MNKKETAKSVPPRIAFFGTPEIAVLTLQSLGENNLTPILVVTKPDAHVGRKKILTQSPIKKYALQKNIPVLEPLKLDTSFIDYLRECSLDAIIVFAYGKIFPLELLELPHRGCLNIHASLLPLYRGASPIQNALLNGEIETGVTLMRMEKGLDTGDIIAQKKLPIDPHDTAQTLSQKLSLLAPQVLLSPLPQWLEGSLTSIPQDDAQATHCSTLRKEDGHVDWSLSCQKVYNTYRAFTPWPGIFSFWSPSPEKKIRIKWISVKPSELSHMNQPNGTVIFDSSKKLLGIVCGDKKVLIIDTVQIEGKPPIETPSFLNGYTNIISSQLT